MTRSLALLTALLALAAGSARAGIEEVAFNASAAFRLALSAPALTLAPKPAAARVTAFSDEDKLIDLLDDNDPAVRAQAARSLKHYALNSYRAENALLGLIGDSREVEAVKREAVKSLAWAAQHYNTKDKLLDLARDSRQTATLRAITLKALFVVANQYDVKDKLKDILNDSHEDLIVRSGAAWGLWSAAFNDYQAREALLSVARNDREESALRVEAVKSLYSAMSDYSVKDKVWDLSKNDRLDDPLREAATLCLHAIATDWSVKSYLEDASRNGRNGAVRLAAIKALGGASLELTRYFHLSHYLGRYIDPLEDQ
jgi:hypothetical protein